jgi:ribosome-binding protein aMBF1 (putative translation factor)
MFIVYLLKVIHTNSIINIITKVKSKGMDSTGDQNRRSRKDVSGQNNPMFGRKHSEASRNKMSQSHQAYQQRIRQAQQARPMTMQEFLTNTPQLDLKGYIQSLVNKETLREIIREEIEKLL